MNLNWELMGWILCSIFGVLGILWIIVGIWFYRVITQYEARKAERQVRQEQIRNRRENW